MYAKHSDLFLGVYVIVYFHIYVYENNMKNKRIAQQSVKLSILDRKELHTFLNKCMSISYGIDVLDSNKLLCTANISWFTVKLIFLQVSDVFSD